MDFKINYGNEYLNKNHEAGPDNSFILLSKKKISFLKHNFYKFLIYFIFKEIVLLKKKIMYINTTYVSIVFKSETVY